MNAVYIHKRNESLNRMWACLAGVEAAVLILYSDLANVSTFIGIFLCIASVPAVVILGMAAPIHYIFACERYINARGETRVFPIVSAVVTMAVVLFFTLSIVTDFSASVAFHFVLPVTFALSALPLKLIPDRG